MLIELVPPAQAGSDVGDLTAAILEGLDGALSPIGEVLHEEVSQRFETQTDPQGRPWTPLSEKTLIARARKTAGTKILIVTAMLKNSFAPRVQRDQRRVSIHAGGPAAAYAATHQFGRGNIPARPMLPVGPGGPPSAALVAEVRATIAESVRAALARYRARRGQR
jgi:phage virion morphogenesis protein